MKSKGTMYLERAMRALRQGNQLLAHLYLDSIYDDEEPSAKLNLSKMCLAEYPSRTFRMPVTRVCHRELGHGGNHKEDGPLTSKRAAA